MSEKENRAGAGKAVEPAGETVYSLEELIQAHRTQFGCAQELVRAAFLAAGKKEATLAEAKKIIGAFRRKEVR